MTLETIAWKLIKEITDEVLESVDEYVEQAKDWAQSDSPPDPSDPNSKSAKTWSELALAAGMASTNYRPTIAQAVEDFAAGEFFVSDDQGGETSHPNVMRLYERTAASPFFQDMGDGAAPISQPFLEEGVNVSSDNAVGALKDQVDTSLGQVFPLGPEAPAFLTVSTGLSRVLEDGDVYELDARRLDLTSEYDNGALVALRNAGYDQCAVTEIEAVNYDISGGQGVTSLVSRITAPGHGAAAGQTWRIWSDDLLGRQHNTKEREAEYIVIIAVDGDYIYTSKPLFCMYTTNIYIIRPSNARVRISNVANRYAGTNPTASFVSLRGFLHPVLQFHEVADYYGVAANIKACYATHITGGWLRNLKNNGGYVGYGINDAGSYASIYSGIHGQFVRHLVTTNAESTEPNDGNWYDRGRSILAHVTQSYAEGCAGPFDSHSDALHMTHSNCVAVGSPRMQDASGAAFQMRGASWTITDCKSIGNKVGLLAYFYESDGFPPEMFVDGFVSIGDNTALRLVGATDSTLAASLNGVKIATSNGAPVDFRNAIVDVGDMRIKTTAATPTSAQIFDITNAQVDIDKLKVDHTLNPNSNNRLFRANSEDIEVRLRDCDIKEGSSSKLSSVMECGGYDVVADITYEKNTALAIGFANPGPGSDLKLKATDGIAVRSYIDVTYATPGAFNVLFSNSSWPDIFVRITCTATGVTVTPPSGKFRGQTATLVNRTTSTQSFTVAGLAGPSVIVPVRQSLEVKWDGSNWNVCSSI